MLLPPVSDSADLRRIVSLPRRQPALPEPLRIEKSGAPCQCRAVAKRDCIEALFPIQRAVLEEIVRARGVFCPIAVGAGKTLIGLLAPVVTDVERTVMLVPAGQENQVRREHFWASQHLNVPALRSPGEALAAARNDLAPPPGLYVLPYSLLSRPEWATILLDIKPQLIIADEGQKLRHLTSVTVRRVIEYFSQNPTTRLCIWSGTLISKNLADYCHLSAMALHDGSPLPLDPNVVADWACCLDASPFRPNSSPGALRALMDGPFDNPRKAVHRRMVETTGVVFSSEASKAHNRPPITFRQLPITPSTWPSQELKDAIKKLDKEWVRPNGEELVLETERYRTREELSCGFFYSWDFGETPKDVVQAWRSARSAWAKAQNGFLMARSRPGLDSPALLVRTLEAGEPKAGSNPELRIKWNAAKVVLSEFQAWKKVENTCNPRQQTTWIDDSWLEGVFAWAERERGLVWFTHDAVGAKLAQRMTVYQDGGMLINAIPGLRGTDPLALSVKSCGTGVDGLQRIYYKQLLACGMAQAAALEQLLGRLDRPGQTRAIETDYFERDKEALEQAKVDAKCVSEKGLAQKLLEAIWT